MLTDTQQAYVYSKIDNLGMRIFGRSLKKPSDICKELKSLTGEQIDALIARDKADAIALAQAKIDKAQSELKTLEG